MFAILFKKKLELEKKVRQLQNNYLQILKLYEVNESQEKLTHLKETLKIKEQVLGKIAAEYKSIEKTYSDLSRDLSNAKNSAIEIDEQLDLLAHSLNIQFPENLKRKEKDETILTKTENVENQLYDKIKENDTDEEDKENSIVLNNPNRILVDSDEYFSPNIQIRKSLINQNNQSTYTPALKKSNSKIPKKTLNY